MNHSPSITTAPVDFSSLLSIMRTDERGEGLTSDEIAQQWGCSQATAQKRLRKAAQMGLVRTTRKEIDFLDGRRASVPAYVMEVRQ